MLLVYGSCARLMYKKNTSKDCERRDSKNNNKLLLEIEENKAKNITNLQKLHLKTESFYINIFLKSSECFLDLFLIILNAMNLKVLIMVIELSEVQFGLK